MVTRMTICMVFILLLCGFSNLSDQLQDQLKKMPQQYEQFDVKIGWRASADKGATVISGVIKNVRYAFMEDIEVWVSVRDADGTVSARAVDYVIPNRLVRDDVASFTIKLPKIVSTDARLVFTYRYVGSDGGGSDGDAINWMQSFEAAVPAGI